MTTPFRITYIGGPTALIEFGGVKLLTDPTFDRAGGDYTTGPVTLHKLAGPALDREHLGAFDYALVSHDHHWDNLDHSGREALKKANTVVTTIDGAQRLGGNSLGLNPWEGHDILVSGGRTLRVIATPARHGPADMDRGPVIGFVLFFTDAPEECIYISGDTVWYEGVAEVARRYPVQLALLHIGAARVPEVGPFHLTMTSDEAALAAKAFSQAAIVPIHFEGWAHFSEGKAEIRRAFHDAGVEDRLYWPRDGETIDIQLTRGMKLAS